ncbi:hypothetical protein [Streptomyces winkii]|uniref:hypothetical protein n=1 Tax=Streptomyces winkii TaxID=3051178 RepID=UPI0028D21F0F|nr:hypothetical protein [Streptomyces sp. DSM 40971]
MRRDLSALLQQIFDVQPLADLPPVIEYPYHNERGDMATVPRQDLPYRLAAVGGGMTWRPSSKGSCSEQERRECDCRFAGGDVQSDLVAMPRKFSSRFKQRWLLLHLAVSFPVELGWSAAAAAAVVAVALLVGLLPDGVRDPAPAEVCAESAGAAGHVRDHVVRAAAWSAKAGAGNPAAPIEHTELRT